MQQYIHTDRDGNKRYYKDKAKTILHREDGPALELTNSSKSWWINGKLHREDGPAIEWFTGDKEWYINSKRHREDGPAVEYADGGKVWWINNVFIFAVNKDGKLIDRME